MSGGVDLLHLADRDLGIDLGIDLGGAQLGVAKHLLDVPDVSAVFEHQRGHGVTEQVAGTGLAQRGAIDVFPHHLGEPVEGELLAVAGEEEDGIVGLSLWNGQRAMRSLP
jgi:hypothetical protein